MSTTFVDIHSRQDQVSIPTIWIAVAISLVLHTLLLWSWPNLLPTELLSPADDERPGKKQGSLAVRLASPPKPPVASSSPTPPPTPTPRVLTKPAPTAHAAPSASAAPRVLMQERPATPPKVAAAPPKPAASTAPAPAASDFASFVEQRRRQREAQDRPAEPAPQQPPAESEQDRHNREVARSLGLNRATGLGGDRNRGGGIFQVMSINPDRASVAFYGWNKTIERKVLQTIEVSRGDQPSIELAVVRRMIELIRAQTTGDLTWESLRLGRDVELSARPKDTQKLEAFLMEEFFWDRKQRP